MCNNCYNEKGEVDAALEAYHHGCSYCGAIPDENRECNCPPEDYMKPGREAILYVNAYELTRHYGGPEEGGWWFNHQEPIASIPIKAISVEGHTDSCYNCSRARAGEIERETGKKFEFCKWGFHIEPEPRWQMEMMKAHLESLYGENRSGNIYSVLGGVEIMIVVEDHVGESTPRPHYE
jgi:hypothetical protein